MPGKEQEEKPIIREFLLSTSVKGIPRIVKAQDLYLRYLWFIAVIVLIAMACVQVVYLLKEYFQYPTVTFVSTEDFTLAQLRQFVPDITVCNCNPFSSRRHNLQVQPSLREFEAEVVRITSCDPAMAECTMARINQLLALRRRLMTTSNYFKQVGIEQATLMGHTLDEFLVKCYLVASFSDGETIKIPCQNFSSRHRLTSDTYFNCFTLTIDWDLVPSGVPFLGYGLVLYLDNVNRTHDDIFGPESTPGWRSGAVVMIHQPDSLMDDNAGLSVELTPGSHTDIKLHTKIWHHQKPPYGVCTPDEELPVYDQFYGGRSLVYQESICLRHCMAVIQESVCGCQEYQPWLKNQVLSSPCKTNMTADEIFAVEECKKSLMNDFEKRNQCSKRCLKRCTTVDYSLTVSSTAWPGLSPIGHLKRTSNLEYFFENHFPTAEKLNNSVHPSLLELLQAQSINDNFLAFDIYMADRSYGLYKEEVKITLSSMMSQLGGGLNLYAGVTVVFLVEVVDLILQFIALIQSKYSQAKKMERAPSITKNDIISVRF